MAIQDAINLIKTACTRWSLGYDQSNRLDFRNGGETDCSALVILTCEQAGLLPGNNIRRSIGAIYTGNMRANFRDRGWRVLRDLPVSQLRPGDVLLKPHYHTAMYVGNGQIAQASIDEHGTSRVAHRATGPGARPSSAPTTTTPGRVSCVSTEQRNQPPPHPRQPRNRPRRACLSWTVFIGDASAKKLQAILGLPQTGVIDKGTFTALQTHVGAPYRDGIASNQNSAAIAAHWPAL